MVVLTVFIFHIMETQTKILANTDKTLNVDLVASNRAWVAPRGIGLEYVPPGAEHWIVGLKFKNTGDQPALKFRRNVAAFPIVSKDIHNVAVLENAILREMGGKKCTEFSREGTGFAVFPEIEHTVRIQISPAHVEQYEANTHFLLVAGYFAYETFGRTGRSCFCRFLDFTADIGNPKNWRSSVCSIPEYAD